MVATQPWMQPYGGGGGQQQTAATAFQTFASPLFNQQNAVADGQVNDLIGQLGYNNLNTGLQRNQINQQAGFQNRYNALDRQAIGNQQNDLANQLGFLQGEYGRQQEGYDIGGQRLDQQQQDAQTGFGLSRQQMLLQNQAQLRNMFNSAAARGGFGGGYQQNFGDAKTLQGIQGQQFENNAAQTLRGFDWGHQDLKRQSDESTAQYMQQQKQAQSAQQSLNLQSQRLGISQDEAASRVTNALQQLGLQNHVTEGQIFSAIRDVELGRYNPLSSILGNIYQATGLGPSASPSSVNSSKPGPITYARTQ